MKIFTASIFFLLAFYLEAQQLKPGKWRAEIDYGDNGVPFIFEVTPGGGDVPEITFINGKERRKVTNSRIEGDSIFIPMNPFDVTLEAKFSAMEMEGVYVKHYRNSRVPFAASYGNRRRFTKSSLKSSARIQEKWKMTFSPDSPSMSSAVGLFKQVGETVTGTVMTETSDYRYFEGIVDGDSLKLSSFDGAHAFLILGAKTGNKDWNGTMYLDHEYSEDWVAKYDENAAIDNPFEIVELEKGEQKAYYDLLGAGSGKDIIKSDDYFGKVHIIQLFGTWCPNSHDQTKYLVDWKNKNPEKGVEIVASSWEANYSKEYGLRRISEYKEANNIPYEVVLGGRLSKTGAAMSMPFIDRLKAFPTLVFVDKSGYARYVHSYFNGPATGEYYEAFDTRFNEIIEELLAE